MAAGDGRDGIQSADRVFALYQELRLRGVSDLGDVSRELGLAPEEYERRRAELIELGLIVPTGTTHATRADLQAGTWESAADAVAVVDPEIALLRMLRRERERLREHLDESDRAYGSLETLVGTFLRPGSLSGSEVEVEILDDYGRIQQVLEDITDVIQYDLASMHVTALVREVADRVLSRDRRQIDNGVRIRAIYHQRITTSPEATEMLRRMGRGGRRDPHVPRRPHEHDHRGPAVRRAARPPGGPVEQARSSPAARHSSAPTGRCTSTAGTRPHRTATTQPPRSAATGCPNSSGPHSRCSLPA